MNKSIISGLIILFLLTTALPLMAQKTYLAYNVWYENPGKVYCINYQTGTIIPAGTEVTDVAIKKNQLSFKVSEDGMLVKIGFNPKYHGKDVTVETLKERLFTTKNFDQLTAGLKSYEIEAIRQGIAIKGMSKRAVLISFGYPPEHKTPNLENEHWTYWRNRFVWKTIPFDESGKVSEENQ